MTDLISKAHPVTLQHWYIFSVCANYAHLSNFISSGGEFAACFAECVAQIRPRDSAAAGAFTPRLLFQISRRINPGTYVECAISSYLYLQPNKFPLFWLLKQVWRFPLKRPFLILKKNVLFKGHLIKHFIHSPILHTLYFILHHFILYIWVLNFFFSILASVASHAAELFWRAKRAMLHAAGQWAPQKNDL